MISAMQTGFYNKLISSTALQTKLGGSAGDKKIYNIKAPQDASLPYVTFGLETDRPIGTFESLMAIEDLTYWINAFSEVSVADVSAVADLVLAVMDDADLTVSGYTNMVCRREFIGTVLWDSDALVYQIPLRYRILLSL